MENDVLYNRIMNVVHEEYGPPGEGTKEITITENGTTTEDVRSYASAEITVTVPNSYTESDEGKVVDSGALVSQSSATYTENDTYDTTLINSVTVNVSGGYDFADLTKPEGALVTAESSTFPYMYAYRTGITSISMPNADGIAVNMCRGATNLVTADFGAAPLATNYTTETFKDCSSLVGFVMKRTSTSNAKSISTDFFRNCISLEYVDLMIAGTNAQNGFNGCSNLKTIVLRYTVGINPLANVNWFTDTPFASDGTGGTLYVPQALISSYESAANWSTILGYANNSIKAIEGSIYETQYADGTPISTP